MVLLESIYKTPLIFNFGKRMSGKTFLSKQIAKSSNISNWTIFTSTPYDWVGNKVVLFDDRRLSLKRLLRVQFYRVKQYYRIYNKKLPDKFRKGLVFDEFSRAFLDSSDFQELIHNHCYLNIFIIINFQYYPGHIPRNIIPDEIFLLELTQREFKKIGVRYNISWKTLLYTTKNRGDFIQFDTRLNKVTILQDCIFYNQDSILGSNQWQKYIQKEQDKPFLQTEFHTLIRDRQYKIFQESTAKFFASSSIFDSNILIIIKEFI